MEDRPQSFSTLHHHRHRPSFPLTLPSFQSSEVGYPSPQPAQESLVQYGSRGEAPTTSFLISNTSPGVRRGSCGGDRVFLNSGAGSLDVDASLGGHLDGDGRMGGHFDDSWYGGGKKEVWDDGESCESAGDCYGATNDLYMMDCEDGARRRVRANCNNYVSCEAKAEPVHSREADVGHFAKQTAAYDRGGGAGSFNNSTVDYCRSDSRVSDSYLEDYGSSCGSGEDQLQPAEVEGPWLSISPPGQGEGRWRGAAEGHALAPGCPPQRSPIGRMYTQKLDSFSDAFLSQRKRRFPVIPAGDSWDFGAAGLKSRQTCVFDSDSYLLPPSSSSSSSPAHPSLPSFPSPPTSSHLMPSVLSPPPTPLPPPSHSPSNKLDSPGGFAGVPGHSVPQGGESLGTLQFFTSRLQPVPAVHSSGMLWNFPLLSHCFPQSAGDPGNTECNLRPSHEDEYSSSTATHDILQSPESIFLASSSHRPSLPPSRVLCPSSSPSLHTSFHLSSGPSLLSGQHLEAAEKIAPPCPVTQKVKNGPASLNQSHLKQQASPVHTGTPFPSVLHSRKGQKRGCYTPRPFLNPLRGGTGLYSNLLSLHHREEGEEEEEECAVLPFVNVGPDFQAELPPCFGKWSEVWSPEDKSPREQLLWKPCDEQEESATIQDQVEKLLSMCSSSCLPGGGSNTELALHCLHYCQGNTMATLEMLLFSDPSPAGDYHYSGCGSWTEAEKNLFNAALTTNGKNFSVIQKMVRTKTVSQCVEFYYLSKKLLDKQKKQREEENRVQDLEQQKSVTPICQPVDRQFALEEAVPVPSLASFFPCKLCGKMFYKIKSRNAHMKIHRQPQEDWTERRLQHQLLTQRLALSHPTNLIPTPGSNLLPPQTPAATFSSSADNVHNSVNSSDASVLDPSTVVSYTNAAPPNSHVIANIDAGDSRQRQQPTPVLPFHQSWGSFGHPPDPATFYCSSEEKDDTGAGTVGGKEPINWQ